MKKLTSSWFIAVITLCLLILSGHAQAIWLEIDCYHKGVKNAGTDNIVQAEFYDDNGTLKYYGSLWRGVSTLSVVELDEKRYPRCDNVHDSAMNVSEIKRNELGFVQLRISGGNAFWMDEVMMEDGAFNKTFAHYGRDGGKGYCLSTETNDHKGGWEKRVSSSGCQPCFKFKRDGKVTNCTEPNPNPDFEKIYTESHSDANRDQQAAQRSAKGITKAQYEAHVKATNENNAETFSRMTRSPIINLAKGKRTHQSSIGYGGESSRAIDGKTNGKYDAKSTTHTKDGDAIPYWEVDLGDHYFVTNIKIHNRTDCCKERIVGARVFYPMTTIQPGPMMEPKSKDKGARNAFSLLMRASSVIKTVKNKYEIKPPKDEEGKPSLVRVVRIQLPPKADNFLSLAEVEVMGHRISLTDSSKETHK